MKKSTAQIIPAIIRDKIMRPKYHPKNFPHPPPDFESVSAE